jgi:aldehyde:ferredoxin oxidoreductase
LLTKLTLTCYPLGPQNKLIFAPGLLTGHMLSSCDRVSVGGKSPLTGGIKESNAGGTTGLQMVSLGIKALIIEGFPAKPGWWVLHLSTGGARFDPADDLAGLGVYETASRLLARYGEKVALALIGPAGEMKLATAGIQNLDKDRVPSRIAARGGPGARWFQGIEGDRHRCSRRRNQPSPIRQAIKKPSGISPALIDHPQTHVYRDYGTAAMAQMSNGLAASQPATSPAGTKDVEAIGGSTCATAARYGFPHRPTPVCPAAPFAAPTSSETSKTDHRCPITKPSF